MIDGELLTAIVFYTIVALLIYKYRKKFTVISKIIFAYKTKRGLNLMRRLARYEFFWKIFSTIAIPVAVYFMLRVGELLFTNLGNIVAGTAGAGVAIAIPGVKIPGSPIFIPFWYGIISIAILAIVHEFSHGIVAAMEGVRLKSVGFGFLAILPLAFVELDEEQLKTMPRLTRLRILSAGSFGNVMLFVILMFLIVTVFSPLVASVTHFDGIEITSLVDGFPAKTAGITEGTIVSGVNGVEITQLADFVTEMNTVNPGDNLTLSTDKGNFAFSTVADPNNNSRSYIGIYLQQSSSTTDAAKQSYGILLEPLLWIYGLLIWVANLNFMIGIMNFLPIWALDGGRIAYDLLGTLTKNEKIVLAIMNIICAFYLALLVFNIIGPALVSLF